MENRRWKEKNVRASSRNRRRSSYYLGSNATGLSSCLCGVSGPISGKLQGQFEETDLKGVACGIGSKRNI